jgi:hypothetical protein
MISDSSNSNPPFQDTRNSVRPPNIPNIPEALAGFKTAVESIFYKCGVPITIKDGFDGWDITIRANDFVYPDDFVDSDDSEPDPDVDEFTYWTRVRVLGKENKIIANGILNYCYHPQLTLFCKTPGCMPHPVYNVEELTVDFVQHFMNK